MSPRKKLLIQSLALGIWSFAFVLPVLLKTGSNIVTWTLTEGSQHFWNGENPYLPASPGHDVFHYPPVFAMVYGVFTLLPSWLHVTLWTFLNAFVFWLGVSLWFPFKRSRHWFFWVALVFAAMELDISLRYQQTNALLTGIVLIALWAYEEKKFALAGSALAIATFIKVFPLLFILPLLFPLRKKFILGTVLTALVLFLLPALVVGIERTFWLHTQEVLAVTTDMAQRQLLDLRSCLNRLGWPETANILWIIVTAVGLTLFFLVPIIQKQEGWMGIWFTLGMATVLLSTPRAESPTFVWIAPGYLFLSQNATRLQKGFLAILGFSITMVYTSAVSKTFFHFMRWEWTSKTLGTLGLWLLAAYVLGRKLWPKEELASSQLSPAFNA